MDDIDFDDLLVRRLIEKNHVPEESWNRYSIKNLAHEVVTETNGPGDPHIFCAFCHQAWPCEIRQALLSWSQDQQKTPLSERIDAFMRRQQGQA